MAKRNREERIQIINRLIRKIGCTGRKFLFCESKNTYGYFVHDGRTLFYVDHYTQAPMKMIKGSGHKTRRHEQNFSSGGTMWGLINDFKDFIYGDDDSNHNHGYGGLYCPHWGYTVDEMESIRKFAIEIGYLKEHKCKCGQPIPPYENECSVCFFERFEKVEDPMDLIGTDLNS